MSSATKRRTGRPRIAALWTVIDELPDPLPVGKPELDALERHFNSILEQCLAGKAGTATVIQSGLGPSGRVGRSGRKQVARRPIAMLEVIVVNHASQMQLRSLHFGTS